MNKYLLGLSALILLVGCLETRNYHPYRDNRASSKTWWQISTVESSAASVSTTSEAAPVISVISPELKEEPSWQEPEVWEEF